jgi:CubicO group peptidase (beta-lactamase class C family)
MICASGYRHGLRACFAVAAVGRPNSGPVAARELSSRRSRNRAALRGRLLCILRDRRIDLLDNDTEWSYCLAERSYRHVVTGTNMGVVTVFFFLATLVIRLGPWGILPDERTRPILDRMARTSQFAPLVTLALLTLFGCDADEDVATELRSHHQPGSRGVHGPKADYIYPGQEWQIGAPEDHCLSSQGLADMAVIAEQTKSTCLVVIHDGVLVGDWYWDGYSADTLVPDVWSVTKSMTSAGLGVAQAEGLLDIHDRASDYIPQWQGSASEHVTIFDLITHTSGRQWDFPSDFGIFDAADQTAYSLAFEQDLEPGTRWDYSNLGTQSLEAVLENVSGGDVDSFFRTKLFEPIGMSASMAQDMAGNTRVYTGLSATCEDMARFGYLYLRKGRWEGQQIVPKKWIAESTAPSTELNDAYGYLWWLNNTGHVVLPAIPARGEFDGKMFPSAPDHMYMALGAFGQMIAVDPKAEMVIVRTTLDYDFNDPLAMGDLDAILGAFESAKLDKCK